MTQPPVLENRNKGSPRRSRRDMIRTMAAPPRRIWHPLASPLPASSSRAEISPRPMAGIQTTGAKTREQVAG